MSLVEGDLTGKKGDMTTDVRGCAAGFEDGGTKDAGNEALETGKGEETDTPLQLPEGAGLH